MQTQKNMCTYLSGKGYCANVTVSVNTPAVKVYLNKTAKVSLKSIYPDFNS